MNRPGRRTPAVPAARTWPGCLAGGHPGHLAARHDLATTRRDAGFPPVITRS
ncbi:hypothetical protein SLNWT_0775 [Streptomyces albus]|uniref:Uncharacterized protein n=1 Tax=Streptomyces albus (strain ATCC 21838 / DSM 41398 / FERM P-419 / JCM 4703 / NBRC 107858) TaxID=1081613 RepID=A0A0B5EQU1_STRA4|nr:hypothetical protein SLNWT_0775 [Streptomyces albus]AOU75465.1 hypothetical protein SLNHY_0774 [Streptomyces albus]AYN31267.1 hypothetical protein DUI70_0765 [Streptomyces albus]